MKVSWKNTFNSHLLETLWGHISTCAKAAKDSGYPYFEWNWGVYKTDGWEFQGILRDFGMDDPD